MRIRLSAILAVTLLTSILFIACSSSNKEAIQYDSDAQMQASIKVMYPGGAKPFMREYGELFNAKYPNVELTVIDYWGNRYKEVLEEEKPDVMVVRLHEYTRLLDENRLYDLNSVITNDAFELEGIHPEIINLLSNMVMVSYMGYRLNSLTAQYSITKICSINTAFLIRLTR